MSQEVNMAGCYFGDYRKRIFPIPLTHFHTIVELRPTCSICLRHRVAVVRIPLPREGREVFVLTAERTQRSTNIRTVNPGQPSFSDGCLFLSLPQRSQNAQGKISWRPWQTGR